MPSKVLFLLVALVKLVPMVGVLSVERLNRLYGIDIQDANLAILLRHRAVLFGVVGTLLVVAAFNPSLRPLAVALGLVSMLSFVVVAFLVGGYGAEIQKVVTIDLIASVLLIGAAVASKLGR